MTERRYSEEEVGAIFELATKAQAGGRKQLPSGDGMTLAGLQEIAKEIGVPPELVAQAARSLDTSGREATSKLFGLPVGVSNVADLGRKMTDAEWDQLVVTLRDTFDAKGRVETDGNFRTWTNSRLQILVEPTPTGHQVRLKTYNSSLVGYMGVGVAMLGMAAFFLVMIAAAGKMGDPNKAMLPFFTAAAGVLSIAWGAVRLPGWARRRREQFKELIDRLSSGGG